MLLKVLMDFHRIQKRDKAYSPTHIHKQKRKLMIIIIIILIIIITIIIIIAIINNRNRKKCSVVKDGLIKFIIFAKI